MGKQFHFLCLLEVYKDICQLSIMSGLEIDNAKKTLIVDNKTELEAIRGKYKKDGKIEYPRIHGGFYKPATAFYYDEC